MFRHNEHSAQGHGTRDKYIAVNGSLSTSVTTTSGEMGRVKLKLNYWKIINAKIENMIK